MRDRWTRLVRGAGARLALLCLAINLAILAGVALRHSDYLLDYRLDESPDARHYVQLGRNLLLEGHYSRMAEPPYAPDLLRTPVYPLIAGALDIVTGPVGIHLVQVAAQIGIVLLLWRLAGRYFGRRAAFWVGLLAATDLMAATSNFSALTEPLFTALTLVGAALLVRELVPPAPALTPSWGRYLAIGGVLAVATLIRPAGVYLPVVLTAATLWLVGRRHGVRPALRAACLLLIPSVVLVGGWILRNQRQFGVPRLSSVDAVGSVYMAGAGAYQVRHGVSRAEAQRMIADEFDLPTLLEAQNPWLSELEVRELDASLRAATPAVLARYPGSLALSTLGGLVKGSVSHNVPDLAGLHRRSWTPPGLDELIRLRPTAFGRLFSNHPALVGAFGWQVGHAVATLGLALLGLWRLLASSAHRPLGVLLLLIVAYLGAGMALFGIDAYYRSRIPMLPYLYLLAGVGASALLSRRSPSSD